MLILPAGKSLDIFRHQNVLITVMTTDCIMNRAMLSLVGVREVSQCNQDRDSCVTHILCPPCKIGL